MDPTACLKEIREIADRMYDAVWIDHRTPTQRYLDDSRRLAELVPALDEWITRGGFLPSPWSVEGRGR